MSTADASTPRLYTAAAIVIGSELLSGRIQDANLGELARFLGRHGVDLEEARFVVDAPEAIVSAVNALRHRHDYLFTVGGMGPTHDDITVECVAQALGLELEVNPALEAAVRRHWGEMQNDARRRLTLVPKGTELVGDPLVSPAGLHIENVYILAGLPQAAKRTLANLEGAIVGAPVSQSRILRIKGPDESVLAAPLRVLADRWPQFDFGSYPFFTDGTFDCDLVVRGRDPQGLDAALAELRQALAAAGIADDAITVRDEA